jgi:hypothetical protein
VSIGSGLNWCAECYPGVSFVTRAFTFHIWSVMSSREGSTKFGYLVTSSDSNITSEIDSMECDVSMTPGGPLCLCSLPGFVPVIEN